MPDPATRPAVRAALFLFVILVAATPPVSAARPAEQMKRTVATATAADWAARDFNEASKALATADYPRAVSLLKGVVKEAGDKPVGAKARQVLADVERQAAGRVARAKDLEL